MLPDGSPIRFDAHLTLESRPPSCAPGFFFCRLLCYLYLMSKETRFSPALVRQLLDYDARRGCFRWRARPDNPQFNARYTGELAGTLRSDGYRCVSLFNTPFTESRLVWAWVYLEWPDGEIDHRNGDTQDNRIENLRLATRKQNARNQGVRRNNRTGLKGVSYDVARRGYRAQIQFDGKKVNLGTYPTAQGAAEAYREAARVHHAEFADWRDLRESNSPSQRERLVS